MGLSSKQVSSDRHGFSQALLQGNTLELPKPPSLKRQASQVQQQQQQQVEQLKCPRCESSNTKFCYYNNYNKSQPRHFCKACKRHWTKGGTLRNVPVGGGRKNKRLKTSPLNNVSAKAASKTNNITANTTTTANSSDNIKMLLQTQQHHPRFSLPLGVASASSLATSFNDDKSNINNNFSEAFYQALVRQPPSSLVDTSITFNNKSLNDGIFMGATTLNDHLQFPYSNLGNFENNPCSISSSNFYNFTGDNNNQSNDVMEEQVITTNNNTSLSSSSLSDHHQQQWKISSTTTANDVIDISSNWGWEDFDKFVTVDADLTMPWDDTEIK